MKYLLGSGFFNGPYMKIPPMDFAKHWLATIRRHANPAPARIVIVTAAGHAPLLSGKDVTIIKCTGNLGNLAAGTARHDFAGWMAPMVITAMIAYNEEMDFVFQEQDCLAFGPYIERMYADMGYGGGALGRPIAGMNMPATQSLFIVRHAYIWKFVRDYLTMGPDDNQHNQGEKKFGRMLANNPKELRRLSFGVDRDRPIPWDTADVYSAQQWSADEFAEGQKRGMIQ